jgi:hypothetical protein
MEIKRATCDRAPLILLYGAEGRGKTTLVCKFPKPLALLAERGLPRGVSVDEIGGMTVCNRQICRLRRGLVPRVQFWGSTRDAPATIPGATRAVLGATGDAGKFRDRA